MELTLRRRFKGDSYTIGTLYVDSERFSDTLEDPVRLIGKNGEGKIYGETAIPAGKYKVILSMSARFKRVLPELLDVGHFTGIRIHRLRTAKDTKGCIGVGENTKRGQILNSPYYEMKIISLLQECEDRGEETYITIK
jgi:hypothetical protein